MMVASARSAGLTLGYPFGRGTNLATRRRQDFGTFGAGSRVMVKESAKTASDTSKTSRHLSAPRQRLDVPLTATNDPGIGSRFDTFNAVTAPARRGRAGRVRPAK